MSRAWLTRPLLSIWRARGRRMRLGPPVAVDLLRLGHERKHASSGLPFSSRASRCASRPSTRTAGAAGSSHRRLRCQACRAQGRTREEARANVMVGARGLERGSAAVHVIVIHNITDPEGLGAAGKADSGQIPSSMTFHSMLPSEDGSRVVASGRPGPLRRSGPWLRAAPSTSVGTSSPR